METETYLQDRQQRFGVIIALTGKLPWTCIFVGTYRLRDTIPIRFQKKLRGHKEFRQRIRPACLQYRADCAQGTSHIAIVVIDMPADPFAYNSRKHAEVITQALTGKYLRLFPDSILPKIVLGKLRQRTDKKPEARSRCLRIRTGCKLIFEILECHFKCMNIGLLAGSGAGRTGMRGILI